MGELSVWHLLIVAVVFLALFGYKKLPDAARSVGRSMRIFRAEMHQMRDEGTGEPGTSGASAPPPRPAEAPSGMLLPRPADRPDTDSSRSRATTGTDTPPARGE